MNVPVPLLNYIPEEDFRVWAVYKIIPLTATYGKPGIMTSRRYFSFSVSWGRGETESTWYACHCLPLFGLFYQPRMIYNDECGTIKGMKINKGNRSTRRKPAPSQFYHHKSHMT
jgi:hypothetical protein